MEEFSLFSQIVDKANENNCLISDIVTKSSAKNMKISEKTFKNLMKVNLDAMKESLVDGLKNKELSNSKLVGNLTKKMIDFNKKNILFGELFSKVIEYSLAVSELNSCNGCIVAAPTAGSCGILPALLFALAKKYDFSEKELLDALICSSGIGYIIAKNAYIAGASGGCQAECGSACAMGAGAITQLLGGTPKQVANASAHALKSFLGLVCDPVAGLVEEPCIIRNVSSSVVALSSSQLALSGINSIICFDEVVFAMKEISDNMDYIYKETALGGLANTKTAHEINKKIFK